MEREDCKRLALAVVKQAVDDWRSLCNGAKETAIVNFVELEHFFKFDCDTYLTGTDLSAERILEKLQRERAQSKSLPKKAKWVDYNNNMAKP